MNNNMLLKEQLHLGEIPRGVKTPWTPEQAAEIERELAASDQEILIRHPVDQVVAAIRAKAAPAPRKTLRSTWWMGLPLTAAAALIAVVALGPLLDNGERIKGASPKLAVFRETTQGPVRLSDGDKAREGDRLQVGFNSFKPSWVLVFSVDGRGTVTQHYPAQGTSAVKVAAGEVLAPEAYILDAAPAFERFFLVVGDHSFDRRDVLDALQRNPRAGSLPGGLTAISLTLSKEP